MKKNDEQKIATPSDPGAGDKSLSNNQLLNAVRGLVGAIANKPKEDVDVMDEGAIARELAELKSTLDATEPRDSHDGFLAPGIKNVKTMLRMAELQGLAEHPVLNVIIGKGDMNRMFPEATEHTTGSIMIGTRQTFKMRYLKDTANNRDILLIF